MKNEDQEFLWAEAVKIWLCMTSGDSTVNAALEQYFAPRLNEIREELMLSPSDFQDEAFRRLRTIFSEEAPVESSRPTAEEELSALFTPPMEYLALLEDLISKTVANCHPRNWSEDYITRQWITSLIHLHQNKVLAPTYSGVCVRFDAFKLTGRLETAHGDVAFLVELNFPGRRTLTGVGFLEAKRIYADGSGSNDQYAALKWNQLQYQASRSSSHRLLLYDFDAMVGPAENLESIGFCRTCTATSFTGVRAATLNTHHAITLGSSNRGMHLLGVPLSYQIAERYFRGEDLDFNPALVAGVKSGAVDGVNYLVVAQVVVGNERGDRLDGIHGIDTTIYNPFEPDRP